jgi:hypothetical protein
MLLQQVVDGLAGELRVPGAYVLVHTPQGRFTAAAGADLRRFAAGMSISGRRVSRS